MYRMTLLTLWLCLGSLAALVAGAQQPDGTPPRHTDVAVLPIMTPAMTPEISKATWDMVGELLATKGYRVASYADTARAMARIEIAAARPALDNHAEAVKLLCRSLGVSRVIFVYPTAADLTTAASAAMPTMISRDMKNSVLTLHAAAWGANTGRCVWETSYSVNQQAKGSYTVSNVLSDVRPKPSRSFAVLPIALQDAVMATFGVLFQHDRTVYGSLGHAYPMSPVKTEQVKNRKGKVEGIRIWWTPSADPAVNGYVVYRALGDDLFPAYPTAVVREPQFIDKDVEVKSTEGYRYLVAPLTAQGVEGLSAEPVMVVVTP